MLTKALSISIIAGLFFMGCGGTDPETTTQKITTMPHQVAIKPKTSREFDPTGEEYLTFMQTYNLNSRIFGISNYIRGEEITMLNDAQHRDRDKKYVFYYDTDHDKSTGYYDEWVPKAGADYLYEDGTIYKYTGTPGSHEWSWEFYQSAEPVNEKPSHAHSFNDVLAYGVTLKQDWSFDEFLGYFDTEKTAEKNWEKGFYFAENKDRVVAVEQTHTTDIYLHSYKRNKEKLNPNELFYTYTFYTWNRANKFIIEGNLLIDKEGRILSDKLLYEVRDYDVVTIIPSDIAREYNLFIKSIEDMTIRDNNWNKVLSLTHNSSPTYQVNRKELQLMISHGDDVTKVDVSNITNMFMIITSTHFNQDISGWDVSNVTNMSNMFAGAWSFNQDISGWNVSNVTNMHNMLYGTWYFNHDLSGWNVQNVTDHHRFAEDSPLEENHKPHFRN